MISLISRSGWDPDDVATSIVSSFGDLVTVLLIVVLANFFYQIQIKSFFYIIAVIGCILIMFPFVMHYTVSDPDLFLIITYSGPAILISTVLSLLAGMIFETTSNNYKQVLLLLPVFSGFVGNSVSIITSLISTTLHRINLNNAKVKVVRCLKPDDVFLHYGKQTILSIMKPNNT